MHAPGNPGIAPTWSSSAKDMVGCALGPPRLWFTTGYGILNEVYYPRVDIPQIRDLGFVVADGKGFWVEVKRLGNYRSEPPEPGIPAVEIFHQHPRFNLRLRIAPDPQRDVLLLEVTLDGEEGMRPYALLAPHLGGTGNDNSARVDRYRGRKVLWADQGPFSLALAAVDKDQRDAWGMASAGYVGTSDGWLDFSHNGALTWQYDIAGPGNVSLIGELPRRATLALGFGTSRESAATLAFSALTEPFEHAWDQHVSAWRAWQGRLQCPGDLPAAIRDQVATSAMVLRVHHDKTYPGALVASLSIPWGNSRDDIGGYHLVWPRDLVESAGALLALGEVDEARSILRYLIATQNEDGHWSQNQWLGGKPFWSGMQLDEMGFPVLLAAALAERGALDAVEVRDMARRAMSFIAANGPGTEQDRWEEDAGINTFTLAVSIAALVGGAQFLDQSAREFALALADYWNSQVEEWASARGTRVAQDSAVDAYYVRIAPPPSGEHGDSLRLVLPIKNLTRDPELPAQEQIGTDFLQLVRFGLRRADDPLIRASVKTVDDHLKVDTPSGPAWRRYTSDGYGEHADGSPFDGTGQGRPWPLLTGERGHYELAAGADPLPYLEAMAAMAGKGGMLPEQVWDSAPIPERNLTPGKPTGAAMPLVWAHAEFIKLVASRAAGKPFDALQVVRERYRGRCPATDQVFWSQRLPAVSVKAGQALGICLPAQATVRWGVDGWHAVTDTATRDTGLGVQAADIPSRNLRAGQRVDFTFRWSDLDRWEGQDFRVDIV
jgi:glucoamylase